MSRVKNALATRVPWQSPLVRDMVLAAILCVADVLAFSAIVSGQGGAGLVLYAITGYGLMMWRRRVPILVFFALWFHNLGAWVWIPDYRPTLGLLVALYTIAMIQNCRTSLIALIATLVTTTTGALSQEIHNPTNADHPISTIVFTIILYVLMGVGSWALGRWVRASRKQMESLEQRRRRAAAEAVGAERSRIARELHDIVSHSVSVMVLQAAGARRMLASDLKRANDALAHIEGIGKESMVELRRLLGVLRDGALINEPDEAKLGPQPGLEDLDTLLRDVRISGLPVRLEVKGKPARLEPSVDLSVYRIVQEALTNSLKHGGPGTTATVRLMWAADLLIDIRDDGAVNAEDPALSTGHGLLGLQERARAVGGHLDAGPVRGGGFRVSATLPIAETKPPDNSSGRVRAGKLR